MAAFHEEHIYMALSHLSIFVLHHPFSADAMTVYGGMTNDRASGEFDLQLERPFSERGVTWSGGIHQSLQKPLGVASQSSDIRDQQMRTPGCEFQEETTLPCSAGS